MIDSEDNLTIQVSDVLSVNNTDLCGDVYYTVELSQATDLISFDAASRIITVDTIDSTASDLDITVSMFAKNEYDKKLMKASIFQWRFCDD